MTTSRTPTLAEVLRTAIDNRLEDLHVALPGKVESYDKSKQVADIKPLIQRNFVTSEGTDVVEALPVIPQVPVVFPRAGDFFISLPIKPGDLVTLLFCERSIDKYTQGNGEDTDPVDLRKHALIDAVAFPGFYPFNKSLADAHADNIVIGKDSGAQIHIKDDEIDLYEENAAEFVALATKTKNEIEALRNTVNTHLALVTGTYAAHTHTAPVGGPTSPPLQPPTPPAAVGDVNATKVKAT